MCTWIGHFSQGTGKCGLYKCGLYSQIYALFLFNERMNTPLKGCLIHNYHNNHLFRI